MDMSDCVASHNAVNFSSNSADVINRTVNVIDKTSNSSVLDQDDVDRSVKWIQSNNFSRIALQFPDELLRESCSVARHIETNTGARVFILGDTSYGSCCVDEVAAQHYLADAIIHFGHSCLSPTSHLPVLLIYGKLPIDIDDCCMQLTAMCNDTTSTMLLLYDVQYTHAAEEIYHRLQKTYPNIVFTSTTPEPCAEQIHLMKKYTLFNRTIVRGEALDCEGCSVIYIGTEGLTLNNMMMTLNKSTFYSYNPLMHLARMETLNINKSLMKRYYKVEQAKDASIVGIIVGTLGVVRYLDVINRLKQIIKQAGKKSYMFSVGKLNVAKLANFMEVDVFVLVACPENSLIDSSDYYKPIVTPFEMEMACNSEREWRGDYVTDFSCLLPGGDKYVAMGDTSVQRGDMSLVTGRMRLIGVDEEAHDSNAGAMIKRDDALTLAISHDAASFLSTRTYQGLEVKLGETPVSKAIEGQSGIAMSYTNEKNIDNT